MSKLQILLAVDQLLNTLVGGYADETLSARAWRNRERKWWGRFRKFVDHLFFWQPNHCEQAYESERDRKQLPSEYSQ